MQILATTLTSFPLLTFIFFVEQIFNFCSESRLYFSHLEHFKLIGLVRNFGEWFHKIFVK